MEGEILGLAAGRPGDPRLGGEVVPAGQAVRPLPRDAAVADAAVVIADEHPPLLVDVRSEEIEQVATGAARADAAALDRIARGHVLGPPGMATVIGGRDVKVPDAGKPGRVVVGAPGRGAEEGDGGAIAIAGDRR